MTEVNQDGLLARAERSWRRLYRAEVNEPLRRAVSFVVVAGAAKALLEHPAFAAIIVSLGCLIWIAEQHFEVCGEQEEK